jgi:hypothetical protein
VKVAEMSRFRSPKEIKTAMQGLADGTVDIVVGTHKLLSADTVKFKNLGLLIIDEEHRFGVRHKEADQGPARRHRRADADGHADSAHAGHGAGRPARPERDRHRAATPPGHQDLRAQREQVAPSARRCCAS